MQIQERIVSVKGHTIGYVIDGAEFTRNQAVKEATKGRISNARVVNSRTYGKHLVGRGVSLYSLDERPGSKRRFASLRNR
jgi:hypothetical protein